MKIVRSVEFSPFICGGHTGQSFANDGNFKLDFWFTPETFLRFQKVRRLRQFNSWTCRTLNIAASPFIKRIPEICLNPSYFAEPLQLDVLSDLVGIRSCDMDSQGRPDLIEPACSSIFHTHDSCMQCVGEAEAYLFLAFILAAIIYRVFTVFKANDIFMAAFIPWLSWFCLSCALNFDNVYAKNLFILSICTTCILCIYVHFSMLFLLLKCGLIKCISVIYDWCAADSLIQRFEDVSEILDGNDECAVCFEKFKPDTMVLKLGCKCKIAYHPICFGQWNRGCAVCRSFQFSSIHSPQVVSMIANRKWEKRGGLTTLLVSLALFGLTLVVSTNIYSSEDSNNYVYPQFF